jgi:hypothetical protein
LTAAGFAASESLHVLFNRGLDNTDFGRALLTRMQAVRPCGDTRHGALESGQVLNIACGQRFDFARQTGTPPAPNANHPLESRGSGELAFAGNTFFADVAAGEVSCDGTVSGNGTLIKRGAGVQALLGDTGHEGVTRSDGGTLRATPEALSQQVEHRAALVLKVATDAAYGGHISGMGTGEKRGPDTLTLAPCGRLRTAIDTEGVSTVWSARGACMLTVRTSTSVQRRVSIRCTGTPTSSPRMAVSRYSSARSRARSRGSCLA